MQLCDLQYISSRNNKILNDENSNHPPTFATFQKGRGLIDSYFNKNEKLTDFLSVVSLWSTHDTVNINGIFDLQYVDIKDVVIGDTQDKNSISYLNYAVKQNTINKIKRLHKEGKALPIPTLLKVHGNLVCTEYDFIITTLQALNQENIKILCMVSNFDVKTNKIDCKFLPLIKESLLIDLKSQLGPENDFPIKINVDSYNMNLENHIPVLMRVSAYPLIAEQLEAITDFLLFENSDKLNELKIKINKVKERYPK